MLNSAPASSPRPVDPAGVTKPLRPYISHEHSGGDAFLRPERYAPPRNSGALELRPLPFQSCPKTIPLAVLALGNPLLGDEGFGLHAMLTLEEQLPANQITFLDGGVLGLNLLPYVETSRRLLVLDLVEGGASPGALFELSGPELLRSHGQKLSEHDTGFQEVLGLATLRGNLPHKLVLLGVQPSSLEFGAPLSLAVVMGMAKVVHRALELLRAWTAE